MWISKLSPTRIIADVAMWCLLKMLGLSVIFGLSMACADGVSCSVPFWITILTICPLFVYFAGAGVLIYETIAKQDTYAIIRAIQTTYTVHLYAIAAFLLFICIFTYVLNFSYGSFHPDIAIFVIPIFRFLVLAGTMIYTYRRYKAKRIHQYR